MARKRKEDLLTAEEARHLLNYDPNAGSLTWRNPRGHAVKPGDIAGSVQRNGVRYVSIKDQLYSGHRLAWLIAHGNLDPNINIVAKNGNYDDLRLENLAPRTPAQTAQGAAKGTNNTSGVRGVSYAKNVGKWHAEITRNHQRIPLGYHDTREEASAAYEKARAELILPELDTEERVRRNTAVRKDAQRRSLWKRLQRDHQGPILWNTFAEFAASIGDNVLAQMRVVVVRSEEPIGPDNFTLVGRSKFDRKTIEGRDAYRAEYRNANKERYRNHHIRNSFGLSPEEYTAMWKAQGGCCAICREPETAMRQGTLLPLAVDHCHATDAIRGLLCRDCNHTLGKFKDNAARFDAAAAYLRRHSAKSASVPASNVIPLKQKER